MAKNELKLFTGNSNPELGQKVADVLGIALGKVTLDRFSDGEIKASYDENVRGTDVFILQSTNPPAENLMELLIMLDAAKRASAKRITAVIPYFGYARQDRKDRPRVAITAKLCADLIAVAGAHRVVTLDLHSAQIQGFFDIPFDHLYASISFIKYLKMSDDDNNIIVSPDIGGVKIARSYGKRLDLPLAILDKRRPAPNVAEIINVIGDVDGKNVLIVDDLVDTAGTLCKGAEILKDKGAKNIKAMCTHPVLSGVAIENIKNSPIEKLYVSNSLPLSKEKHIKKIKVISIASIFADAIERIHYEQSISSLFNNV